jgi:predicted nicotinamide N-methyase
VDPLVLRLTAVPLVPEVSLHLAPDGAALFGGGYSSELPPPFWAFAWAGGRALARYVLDHRELVDGRTVLDVATGGGVAAIAAAKAGAARVRAIDRDPAAVAAVRRNAEANGVTVEAHAVDVTETEPGEDVVLAGDVFYEPSTAGRMRALLRRAALGGATVLVGDPGRGYFPMGLFTEVASYDVPVPPALEETRSLRTGVWRA